MTLIDIDTDEGLAAYDAAEPEIRIDPDTGEILEPAPERFVVDSTDRCEWVLRKLGESEARKAGLVAERDALHRQIDANFAPLIAECDHMTARLHFRFDGELEAFARASLAAKGWVTKTLKTRFGRIELRTIPERLRVIDKDAALRFALIYMPDRVKRIVNDADVIAAVKQLTAEGDLDPGEGFVEQVPAEERMFVKTGVEGGA